MISIQPASQSICAGSNVTFSVTSATALSYQWQLSIDGGTNFTAISGATSSTYTVNAVTAAQNNYQYLAVVNGQCNLTTSNPAVLTVLNAPAITSQPQNVTLCIAGNNTFSATATGTGITYQWQLSTNGGAAFSNISGAVSSSYTLSGVTADMNNNQYRVMVSGTCTPPAASNAAILTVISPVTVTAQPENTEVCSASNTSFTVAGNSAETINYQWQLSTDAGANYNNISNTDVYSGATTAELTITGATTGLNNAQYRVLLSNATCTVPTVSGQRYSRFASNPAQV